MFETTRYCFFIQCGKKFQQVLSNFFFCRKNTVVTIDSGCFLIEIPRGQVRIIDCPALFYPLHQTNFGMHFIIGQSIIHIYPFFLKSGTPKDIGLFIKPGFEFYQAVYLFTIFRCVDQGINYPGVFCKPV
ncbi:hypothetical protein D3C85_1135770 [compost metagenome]